MTMLPTIEKWTPSAIIAEAANNSKNISNFNKAYQMLRLVGMTSGTLESVYNELFTASVKWLMEYNREFRAAVKAGTVKYVNQTSSGQPYSAL